MAPLDVPWQAEGHTKEPNPGGRIEPRRNSSPEEEGAERIARRGLGIIREEGDHPATLATDAEPPLLLTSPRSFPADGPSASLALVRWRCALVHSILLPSDGRALAVAPAGPHPLATVRPEAGWRVDPRLPLEMLSRW
jgi:hypothetical protein